MKNYLYHNMIAFDQSFNALTGGYADETFSARVYRHAREGYWYWLFLEKCINGIFFWQEEHCKGSYEAELTRKHSHINYK